MDMDKEIDFGGLFKKKDKQPKAPKPEKKKAEDHLSGIHKRYQKQYHRRTSYNSYGSNNRSTAIVGGIILIAVLIVTVLFVKWIINNVDGFFKEGVVHELRIEPLEIRQYQREREVTRTATRIVPKTKTIDGKTTTTMVTETYQKFDHYEYDLYEETDNIDYIVTLRGESKKDIGYRDKDFYIVERIGISEKDYYNSLLIGSHQIVKEMHVKKSDSNNDTVKLDTSRRPFEGVDYMNGIF